MDPQLAPWVQLSQVYWMSYKLLERRLLYLDVSSSQARVLLLLYRSDQTLKVSDISTPMFQEVQTITGMVHRLEARGWVERESDPIDGRAVRLRLSRAGREIAAEVAAVAEHLNDQLFSSAITDKDSRQLVRALRKVRDHAFELPETDFRLRRAQRYKAWRA